MRMAVCLRSRGIANDRYVPDGGEHSIRASLLGRIPGRWARYCIRGNNASSRHGPTAAPLVRVEISVRLRLSRSPQVANPLGSSVKPTPARAAACLKPGP